MITDVDISPSAPIARAGSAPSSALSFSIPTDEDTAYRAHIPHECIEDARRLLATLSQIHSAPKKLPACTQLAAQMQRSASICSDGSRLTRVRTWSATTLRAKYYAYINGTREYPAGDWRICLDKSRAPIDRPAVVGDAAPATNRPAFVEFWRKLGEDNQRDWSAAYNELIHIWKTGFTFAHTNARGSNVRKYTSIPGYATWPKPDGAFDHPAGWSYANLMRHVSDPYDQVAARIGHSKASQLRIPALTDRTKIEFSQYVEFDDHEFNMRTLRQRRPMRPLAFGAVEVQTDCMPLIGCKPTEWDYEAEVKKKLTERHFMWFHIAYWTNIGYRADIGTEAIVERGTAAIRGDSKNRPITDALRTDMEKRLYDVTGGKITVYRGGRHGQPAHAGQFSGRSKGNFKTKALVEGMWRILDDQMASLPAQVGKDRDHAPEQLYGAEQYTAALFRQVDALQHKGTPLSNDQLAQLQFPFPMFSIFAEWMLDAVHRINTTSRHNLQGWEKLGYVQPIWRLTDGDPVNDPTARWLPWQQFLQIPPEKRAAIQAMLDANTNLVSSLRLSRRQVFDAQRKLLTRIPLEMLPGLVGIENAIDGGRPVPVERGLFSFESAEIDTDPVHFYARRPDGTYLPNGEKYVLFCNPYAPSHLVACAVNASGKLVVSSVCDRYEPAGRNDEAALNKILGAQQSFEAQSRTRLNLRHADQAEEKRAMIAHNNAILNPRAVVNPRLKNYSGDITELADIAGGPSGTDPGTDTDTEAFVAAPQPAATPAVDDDDPGTDALL